MHVPTSKKEIVFFFEVYHLCLQILFLKVSSVYNFHEMYLTLACLYPISSNKYHNSGDFPLTKLKPLFSEHETPNKPLPCSECFAMMFLRLYTGLLRKSSGSILFPQSISYRNIQTQLPHSYLTSVMAFQISIQADYILPHKATLTG